jgi:peptide/nickel transport system substrate-binding protein
VRSTFPVVLLCTAAVATACTDTTTPSAEGTVDDSSIVLADQREPTTLNPLLGYGPLGASKIYDGLVTHRADRALEPALATDLPVPSADGRAWTVSLRQDVRFSDGSAFGPEDVVATYRAVLDPAAGATVRSSFSALTAVEQVGATTVRFVLDRPQPAFPQLLVLGVLPSEAIVPGAPLASAAVNTAPVGTGPYRLAEWRKGDRLVLEANPEHSGAAPRITRVTVVFVPDDNARAQRMQAGEFDGAALPPRLASSFADVGGMRLVAHRAADARVVALPSGGPVTGDAAVRAALNVTVDRDNVVKALLAGRGTASGVPLPPVLPEFAEPGAGFSRDTEEAKRLLDEGGWAPGPDGIRVRDGVPARFTLMYQLGDAVDVDLATAFATDARAVGVDVQLAGLSAEAVVPRLRQDAVLHHVGNPFDPDLATFRTLRSTSSPTGFDNPGAYADPTVDAALDAGRTLLDPGQRAVAYRRLQRAWTDAPGSVYLAWVDHTYVLRDNWTGYTDVVDGDSTSALTWGPWWNLETWTPK